VRLFFGVYVKKLPLSLASVLNWLTI